MSWDFYAEFNVSFLFIIVCFLPSLFFAFYRNKFILSFSSIAFRNWFLELII